VDIVDNVAIATKTNTNRIGKIGRKRKEDGAMPSNKLKK
jgi:hypothetical protein